MRITSDKELEALLRGASFSNPAHKDALRSRLFSDTRQLALDELAMVAGGAAAESFQPEDWPELERKEEIQ